MVRELIQGDDRSKWIADSNHDVKCFTENEIKRITNDFTVELGRGAFGVVYKGVLQDRRMVAVKRFIHNVQENFAKELTVHREINHKNVVRLIGYCVDEKALVMVTEYIPKGNLSDALHHHRIPITLDTRLRIAIECAETLGYMHSQMYTQVIHGDIKPANILLDDRLGAKISDFGISRLVNTENTLYTVNVIGSIGYMDPMFARTGRLTAKSDVYSFGVVLLELVTRKKARNVGEIHLAEIFTKALAKGIRRVKEMFDAEIAIPSNMKTIEQIAQLAGNCLSMEFDGRPEMLEVAERLRRLRKALHQGQERRALFSWGKKKTLAPVDTPLQDSSSSSHNVGSSSTLNFVWIELDDLHRASTEVLGKGTTYKAVLENGATLVVKRLRVKRELLKEEFEQHVTVIGAIQNEHIAPLQRYFYSKDEKLVVYNYFPMGSLADVLHGDQVSGIATLNWKQRTAILLAAARGVACIHSAGPTSCHGNIKPSNVLLSSTHGACVSEHGLRTLGLFPYTRGYRAPEVTDDQFVSQSADVYSFGVLMLELLTSYPVKYIDLKLLDLPQWVRSVAYVDWAAQLLRVDPQELQQGDGAEQCMMLHTAAKCHSQDANLRPTMSDIVRWIKEIYDGDS